MANDTTLNVKWVIDAEDNASKILQRLDKIIEALAQSQKAQAASVDEVTKANQAYAKSQKVVETATEANKTSQKGFIQSLKDISSNIASVIAMFVRFTKFVLDFDYDKVARYLKIIAFLLDMKGFDKLAGWLRQAADGVKKVGDTVEKARGSVDNISNSLGTLKSYIVGNIPLFQIFENILTTLKITAYATVGGFLALAGVAMYTPAYIKFLSILKDTAVWFRAAGAEAALFIRDVAAQARGMGEAGKSVAGGLGYVADGVRAVGTGGATAATALGKATTVLRNVGTEAMRDIKLTRDLGMTFVGAATSTELFSRGITGIVARVGAFGAAFLSLGKILLGTDNIMAKMAGITLVALSAALAGAIVVVKAFLDIIGDFVYKVGTGMVGAMQKATEAAIAYEYTTFTFTRTIEQFNKAFGDSTGTVDDWTQFLEDLRGKTTAARTELQQITIEAIEVGKSLGFSGAQIKEMIKLSLDLAKATKRDVLDSMNAVIGGLTGNSQSLQYMGFNLSEAAVAAHEFGKANAKQYDRLTDNEKALARFNTLMQLTIPIQGTAAAVVATTAERMKMFKSTMTDLLAKMGEGAKVIEQQVSKPLLDFLRILEKTPQTILTVIGFLGALGARMMQVAGIMLSSIFTIGLLVTSYQTLNKILAATSVQEAFGKKLPLVNKSIIQLIKGNSNLEVSLTSVANVGKTSMRLISKAIAETAADFLGLAEGASITAGAILRGFGMRMVQAIGLVTRAILAANAAMWTFITSPVVLTLAAIVGAAILLWNALKLIDERTKIVTQTWAKLVAWWKDSGPLVQWMKAEWEGFLNTFVLLWQVAVRVVAYAILETVRNFMGLWEILKAIWNILVNAADSVVAFGKGLYDAAVNSKWFATTMGFITMVVEKAKTAWNSMLTTIADWYDKMITFLSRIKIISEANAAEQKDWVKAIKAGVDLTGEETEAMKDISKLQKGLLVEIRDIWTGETKVQVIKAEQLKTQHAINGSAKDYAKILEQRTKLEDEITKQRKAQAALAIGDVGAMAGMSQRDSEAIFGATMKGGEAGGTELVNKVMEMAAIAILGPLGEIVGQLITFFNQDQAAFAKNMDAFMQAMVDLPARLADNIPVFITKLIEAIPRIVRAFAELAPRLTENLIKMVTDPAFWEAIMNAAIENMPYFFERAIQTLTRMLSDPGYWLKVVVNIVVAMVKGFVQSITKVFGDFGRILSGVSNSLKQVAEWFRAAFQWIVDAFNAVVAFFKGVWDGITAAFTWVAGVFEAIGKAFSDAVEWFKQAVEDFVGWIKKIFGGTKAGDPGTFGGSDWGVADYLPPVAIGKAIGRAFGFESGGIIDAIHTMDRAQRGILVGGNSVAGDRTVIRANAGEMVLTRDQQRNLFNMIQQGNMDKGDKTIVVNLTVGKDKLAETILQLTKDGYRLA